MSTTYSFGVDCPKDTIFRPTDPHPLISDRIKELEIALPNLGYPLLTVKVIINPFLPTNVMMWGNKIFRFNKDEIEK